MELLIAQLKFLPVSWVFLAACMRTLDLTLSQRRREPQRGPGKHSRRAPLWKKLDFF